MKCNRLKLQTIGVCLTGALVTGSSVTPAQAAPAPESARLEKLENENKTLRERLEALEIKEGITSTSKTPDSAVKMLSGAKLSGFVTASYFYDFSQPKDGVSNGYLWSPDHNSFTINKVKLVLEKPAEKSGDKFDAGYHISMIFGQDAKFVNTGGELQGLESLRQAYVELNVPVGTGLNVKAGQLISLLNFESGDGGAANPNFSQGNQWFFTGNGPSTGVQLGYSINDVIGVKARVQNGLFTGVKDNNGFKTMMGSVDIKPDDKTGLSLIGFAGREGAANNLWLKGGSLIGSRKLTDKYNLTFATELDYFSLDLPGSSAKWWSAGGWLWADITSKVGAALRVDYIHDSQGFGTAGLLGFANMPTGTPPGNNAGMDLTSFTFTLNIRPTPNIKIQPEIRYDHSSLAGAFDGVRHRVIAGMGVSYLF